MRLCSVLLAGLLAGTLVRTAERAPVLPQIDLPHPYYYREMYLPQLTSGPSSVAWSPDSTELIYAMAGSLWRQKIGSSVAQQLTASAAYDYQPDWSPDGRWVIYCAYDGNAVELWILDLSSGAARPLTKNGAVNVEPRFSPDGKRVVFTSTLYNKRFHLFTADFSQSGLANIQRLTGEHKSDVPRYYYSPYDHEINPVWTRDGRDILYVSNRNHIYGTGGFWRTSRGPNCVAAAPQPATLRPTRGNFITRRRIGSPVPTSRPMGRGWCTAPISGAPGTICGCCRWAAGMHFRSPTAIGT